MGRIPKTPGATPGRPPKLTGEDLLIIARLHGKGLKSRTIARLLSTPARAISHQTVVRYLQRAQTPSEAIKVALASLRGDAVESWQTAMRRGARDGKHAPAKDLLIATGDIKHDTPTDRLVIIVGDGQTIVGSLPTLPVSVGAGSLLPAPDGPSVSAAVRLPVAVAAAPEPR